MANSQPTFAFADDTPVQRGGRKHRRGRGYGVLGRRNNSARGQQQQQQQQRGGSSFRLGGNSSSAARQAQGQPQSAQNNDGDNSCTGSLTYSASSSVQSAESSNDSSFADIIKLIDSEGEGASEIKDFIAKQTMAASDPGASGARYNQFGQEIGGGVANNPAVQGWMQRVGDRTRAQQQAREAMQAAQAQKKRQQQQQQQQQFTMASDRHVPSNPNVDFNYSKDDSSEDDVFSVDFDDKVLETIGGLDRDDDVPAHHNGAATSPGKSNQSNSDPFSRVQATRQQDPYQSPISSPFNSAPSSPRSGPTSPGHVTPPPTNRHKRMATPPGAQNISRTNSRQSKSSSDGSWDTPAPSSPPHNGAGGAHGPKPPHARSVPVGKSRRKSGGNDQISSVEDLSEAFYAKSWMCGFADAFKFDGKL